MNGAPYEPDTSLSMMFNASTHKANCGSRMGSQMALGMCTCTREDRLRNFESAVRIFDIRKISNDVRQIRSDILNMRSTK